MINTAEPKLDCALTAVRDASLLVREIQGEMITSALTKEDRTPVTVADFAAQAVVGYYLERSFPRVSLVAEEDSRALRSGENEGTLDKITHYVTRIIPGASPKEVLAWIDHGNGKVDEHYWTLDPIDGTKGFLRGDQYAICLAYVNGSQVQIGVLGCPNLTAAYEEELGGSGSLFFSALGQGSWMTGLDDSPHRGDVTALHVSQEDDSRTARLLRSFESGHTNVDQIVHLTQELDVEVGPVRLDSQAKYALLAGGKAEIYLRLLAGGRKEYRETVWDQASGCLLVEEAGGKVTDLDGKTLDFSQGERLVNNRGICATNGILHEITLDALRKIGA